MPNYYPSQLLDPNNSSGNLEDYLYIPDNISVTELNSNYKAEKVFMSGQLSGDIGNIYTGIKELITSKQDSLNGSIDSFIDGKDLVSINGGDLSYNSSSYTIFPTTLILVDNGLSSLEVDNLLIDAANHSSTINEIVISGNNANHTSLSDLAISTLENDGVSLVYSGIPVESLDYDDIDQDFIANQAIIPMNPVITPDASPDVLFEDLGDLIFSTSATTGIITGSESVADDYSLITRVRAYGDYTGHTDTINEITVSEPSVSTGIFQVNFSSSTDVLPADDGGKYWNNVKGSGVTSINGIVDTDNNTSSYNVGITSAFTGSSDTGGKFNALEYPTEAWLGHVLTNNADGEITFSGLDNGKTYNVVIGASRGTSSGTGTADYTIGATTIPLDAELSPPQYVTFSNQSPTSGDIVINVARQSTVAYVSFMVLIEN